MTLGTDFHTYYNNACFDPSNPVPSIYNQEKCPDNYDQGYVANLAFKRAKYFNAGSPDAWDSDGTSDFQAVNSALGLAISASSFTVILNKKDTSFRTLSPTGVPSPAPSPVPTS